MEEKVLAEEAAVIEKERTYIYDNDFHPGEYMTSTYCDVIRVEELPSGSHRIFTKDGGRHFASNGFIHIRIVPVDKE